MYCDIIIVVGQISSEYQNAGYPYRPTPNWETDVSLSLTLTFMQFFHCWLKDEKTRHPKKCDLLHF